MVIKQLRKIVVKLWKNVRQESVNMGLGLRESSSGGWFFSLRSAHPVTSLDKYHPPGFQVVPLSLVYKYHNYMRTLLVEESWASMRDVRATLDYASVGEGVVDQISGREDWEGSLKNLNYDVLYMDAPL